MAKRGFFERINSGLAMVRTSATVLNRHPRLMILPVISAVALAGAVMTILLAVAAYNGLFQHLGKPLPPFSFDWNAHSLPKINGATPSIPVLIGLGLLGWVLTSISLYFNAALTFCVLRCFAGQPPSIRDGLTASFARLPQIVGWAFVATLIGGLLRDFWDRADSDDLGVVNGLLVGLLIGLFGLTWAVATYFVLPVLVVEGTGPVATIKQSAAVLRKTWGETVVGNGGFGLLHGLISLPAVLLLVGGVLAVAREISVGALALVGLAAVYLTIVAVVFGTLGVIFRTGLYVYATTGHAPFDAGLMQDAFRPTDAKSPFDRLRSMAGRALKAIKGRG